MIVVMAVISLATHLVSAATPCEAMPGTCSFYLCRELEHRCGSEGYYVGFGYKYCDLSLFKMKPKMSEKGQLWADKTAQCLQEQLAITPETTSCEDAKTIAIDSHVECYVRSGICHLPAKDMMLIGSTVKNELKNPQIIDQMVQVKHRCAEELLRR